MIVEIAICTWNRGTMLRSALKRLCEISCPDGVVLRLIVVDNNSTDQTSAVIEEFKNAIEIIATVEKRQGHCYARNAAIEQSSGDFLIWIDDDVRVSDVWLDEYIAAFKADSEYAFWGGKIIPIFEPPKPKWIDEQWDKLKGCFAFRDLGNEAIQFTSEILPYGANFAIRTEVQKQINFDVGFGRTDEHVTGEDEMDMLRRVIDAGHRGRWIPGALVYHQIDSSRMTEAYIEKYFVGQGLALIARGAGWDCSVDELEKESRHELFCYRMKRYFTSSEVWVSHLIRGSLAKGQYDGIRRGDESVRD